MFERKKLGLLQPNLQGKLSYQGGKIVLESTTSRKRKNDENQTPVKSARKDGIYEDPATPLTKRAKHCHVSGVDAAVQTEQTLLTPLVNCQAAAIHETSSAVASTSSNDCSGSLVTASAPQIGEAGLGAATPIQNEKTVALSAELKIPKEKGLSTTSNTTQSELDAAVEVQQSIGEKEQTSTDVCAGDDMLTSEVPGSRYWEMIAAERKAALTAALSENRQLYQRNSELQDRVHHLENDNTLLESMVQESRIMMNLILPIAKEQPNPEDLEQLPSGAAEDLPLNPSNEEQTSQSEPLFME